MQPGRITAKDQCAAQGPPALQRSAQVSARPRCNHVITPSGAMLNARAPARPRPAGIKPCRKCCADQPFPPAPLWR